MWHLELLTHYVTKNKKQKQKKTRNLIPQGDDTCSKTANPPRLPPRSSLSLHLIRDWGHFSSLTVFCASTPQLGCCPLSGHRARGSQVPRLLRG